MFEYLIKLEEKHCKGASVAVTRTFVELFSLIILVTFLFACGSSAKHYDQSKDATGKPGWVSYGTQTSKTEVGRIFLGVGVATTEGEFTREATTANNRAKDEIKRMVSRFIEVVSRDYIATGAAEPYGYLANEANRYIKEMTDMEVANAKIMEHWVDNVNNKVFAIAEIDYPKVYSVLSKSEQVNSGFKKYLKNQGKLVFDRIATQH